METMAALVIGLVLASAIFHTYGYVSKTLYDGIQAAKVREKTYWVAETFNSHIQQAQSITVDDTEQKIEITGGLYGETKVFKFDELKFYIGSSMVFDEVSGNFTFNNGLACLSLNFKDGGTLELYSFKRSGG